VKAIIFTSPKEGPADRILESVVVGVDDTVGNLTLDTYIQDFIRNMRTTSTLSGFAAHQIIFSSSQLKELHVPTIKNKVLYWIMYVAEREKYDKFLYAAEQMISSFELLD
jgi:hypothetical protein